MRAVVSIFICASLFGCASTSSVAQAETIEGNWVGGFKVKDDWVVLNASFRPDGRNIKGTADITEPSRSRRSLEVSRIKMEGPRLHFEISESSEALVFDGTLKEGIISGEFVRSGVTGPLNLVRTAKASLGNLSQFIGSYELAPGQFISITYTPQADGLRYLEFKSGRAGTLYPLAEDVFFGGPTYLIPAPIDVRIAFKRSKTGDVTGLVYSQSGSPERIGIRINLKQEEAVFRHKDASLAGTLTLPASKGPHPAIVMIAHESRDTYQEWAYLFASNGLAVLRYDKRGHGESTGEYYRANLDDHAGDAIAGIRFLQSRKDIKPNQVGLWGISWAGWIAQLAASQTRDVAFIITISGPAVPPWQQETYKMEPLLRADGYPESTIREAVDFMKLKFEVARTGNRWNELESLWEKAQTSEWSQLAGMTTRLEWLQLFWNTEWSYDPIPALEKLTCPVLAIFGSLDVWVPVRESAEILERVLKKAGNSDYTIKVLEGANHGMWQARNGGMREFPGLSRRAGLHHDLMVEWLIKRVEVSK